MNMLRCYKRVLANTSAEDVVSCRAIFGAAKANFRGRAVGADVGREDRGVTVDRINVTRMGPVSAAESSGESRNDPQQQGNDGRSTGRDQADQQQREQARRDAVLRRWRSAA